MSLSEKLVDKRVLRRTLDRGTVSREDFDKYLSELPDVSSNIQKPDGGDGDHPTRQGDGPA